MDSTLANLATRFNDFIRTTDVMWTLEHGDLEYGLHMEDLSPEGLTARRDGLRGLAAEAAGLHASLTDLEDRVAAGTIAFYAEARADQLEWGDLLHRPSHTIGMYGDLVAVLPRLPASTPDRAEGMIERYRNTATMLDQMGESLRLGAADGHVAFRHTLEEGAALLAAHLRGDIGSDPLLDLQGPPAWDRIEAWRTNLEEAVARHIRPALSRLRDTIVEDLLPVARPDNAAGMTHMVGGDEAYAARVRGFSSLDVTPEEVHQTGLDQVERLAEEYRDIAGPILGTTDVTEILRRLQEDPALRYESAAELIADADAALAKATAAAPDWFETVPQADCVTEAIEVGPLAYYSAPAEDGSRPGRFFFNTSDPSAWARYQVAAVTHHEGVPGHHLQIAGVQENPAVPHFQKLLYLAAYSEGWGLYTERLADEMGLYPEPMDRVGMLAADSMRACRLVVDTGVHALGWTRDQAIAYIVNNSPLSLPVATNEADRYISYPGQAISYMMGRLTIDRIRAEAEARLGGRFDIKGFHSRVLGFGEVPMGILDEIVSSWEPS